MSEGHGTPVTTNRQHRHIFAGKFAGKRIIQYKYFRNNS